MVFCIIVIANLNLLLGFAVAAELGRRCRRAALAVSAAGSGVVTPSRPASVRPKAMEPAPPKSPAAPLPDVGPLMERLESARRAHQEAMATADEQLRKCIREPRQEELANCLTSFSAANQRYIEEHGTWRTEFDAARQKAPSDTADQLAAALDIHGGQIAATQRLVNEVNMEGDLQAECRRLLQETHRLALAGHKVRDSVQEQLLCAGPPKRGNAEGVNQSGDPLTGLPNRGVIDTTLNIWLAADTSQRDPLCLAAFDIDGFGPFNERHGQRCGDRVLRAIAKLLKDECPSDALITRTGGQTFTVLLKNHDIRQAGPVAERFRQVAEQASFDHQGVGLRLTVSCGVVEMGGDESIKGVIDRLEQTLREAKRYGRNRCFIHEGRYPTPIPPSVFAIEPQNLPLQ